jgi:hypothetical protein
MPSSLNTPEADRGFVGAVGLGQTEANEHVFGFNDDASLI